MLSNNYFSQSVDAVIIYYIRAQLDPCRDATTVHMTRSKTIGFDSMYNDSEEAGNLLQVHGNFRWAEKRAKQAIVPLQISSFLHGKKVTIELRALREVGNDRKGEKQKSKKFKSSL
ncbi:hypothetical protein CEXT_703291 [Caerostris extrusa]|uniref:Uncharacterized protein n=1 Tax=Caerostris extrusa TaxID=172846 RepID=A0AAV4WJ42_CAEEX|nr:hypothetical protein CEXT_703291 [Caerostris extrusa]